jgi:hypothetical protein
MSTLQVANIHLESTGNNRIQYAGSNTFTMYAGGAGILAVNSTTIAVGANVTVNATAFDVGNTTISTTSAIFGGTITAVGDITAFATSDVRLKTNIENITDALSKVCKLDGVTYNWNDLAHDLENKNTNIREAGVLAGQINEVLPEIVSVRESGYMAVRYERIVPLLVEAIKELQAKVEKLEKRV